MWVIPAQHRIFHRVSQDALAQEDACTKFALVGTARYTIFRCASSSMDRASAYGAGGFRFES
jgi:hypothetical protein